MKPNKRKRIIISVISVIAIIALMITVVGNSVLSVSEYTISLSGLTGSARVVVISDLHG